MGTKATSWYDSIRGACFVFCGVLLCLALLYFIHSFHGYSTVIETVNGVVLGPGEDTHYMKVTTYAPSFPTSFSGSLENLFSFDSYIRAKMKKNVIFWPFFFCQNLAKCIVSTPFVAFRSASSHRAVLSIPIQNSIENHFYEARALVRNFSVPVYLVTIHNLKSFALRLTLCRATLCFGKSRIYPYPA